MPDKSVPACRKLLRQVAFSCRFVAQVATLAFITVLASVPAATWAESEPGVVLVFGDSLSAAYRMDEEQGWVALLQQRVDTNGLDWQVQNASVSGETTSGGLARLPAVLDSTQPDIVILELGGNDGLRGLPVPTIRANLQQMIELSQQAGARVMLVGIQIPPNYGPRYTQPFYDQYQELADQYGTTLIPFLLDGIADQPELMQDDGIHPRAEAQGMIVDIVWPVLLPMMEPES
ncbi:arylesterase [Pseudohongiella sp. SYSU M77423]|uniref:arylesterase n=1 Tax=Pseudohongiella sp. SYSU M77423 TaxID=3042312 RepID=UPI002480D340|nr:arylesterase [Pseudohongiella sp. SYSU M77423]MDH7942633.1 arylesterase [Pseudohongiella sp. SYSU M77423]